jgi:hypothetical protein
VQTLDGRWLSIDGRVLFKANVAASETYNTALEQHLRDTLGVRFTERPSSDPAKRPVREIVGVDPRLNQRWSTRRAHIQVRQGELAVAFQRDHGRPPTPIEALHLTQQATLETRQAKHEPRSLAEQRATWQAEAATVLGGRDAVTDMVAKALSPWPAARETVDAAWVSQTADRVLAAMEERRSTWQMWHVRAEAQRHIRTTDIPAERSDALVDLLVDDVLHTRSVLLAPPDDGIEEPEGLRRVDGSSVYTVAGADLYTSRRILDAEQRLVTIAGRHDGATVDQTAVDLALLEMAANGTILDAGQASLVRQMCTSGRRLQLAIAPAGAGKTTALWALALAWTQDGGDVAGLAPSAAAAAVLREQTGIGSDTLAKLTWSVQRGELPEWAAQIGPSTLVIIDEAGMADTVTLDTAVQFVIAHGGSVRLVGDDQHLAAIGAGGVLRDTKHTHGALQLTELHRFTDPDEAAASLALRDGKPEALDFYLNQGRVHVGGIAAITQDAFSVGLRPRGRLDAIMLAPTRTLVAELNCRARNHRLNGDVPDAVVRLADGNEASAGDVITTRSNDRRLRLTATDWVKNGDRWTITGIGRNGDLKVRHNRSRLSVRLPADYVRHSTGLGYAGTIHAAQGVSADTMHGLLSGQESRQQLYTMLTRGRAANHLYLQVVGDGDPHTVIRPETVTPRTPTEILHQILARDDTPASATSLLREHRDPAARLCDAVRRYTDSLQVAAEQLLGPQIVQMLDARADQVVPHLTNESSWPTLRAHLLTLAAETGEHPTSPTRFEVTLAWTKPSPCGRRRAAAPISPSSMKSPCGGPPTASTPTTHDQPEQHSCPQLRPSGNTTSTEVSPGAVTTTTVLTSQSRVCSNLGWSPTPRSTAPVPTTSGPPEVATPHRPIEGLPPNRGCGSTRFMTDRGDCGRPPATESASIRSRAGAPWGLDLEAAVGRTLPAPIPGLLSPAGTAGPGRLARASAESRPACQHCRPRPPSGPCGHSGSPPSGAAGRSPGCAGRT